MVRTTASYNNLYYDSQTSKARQKFDLCCCHGQLAPFPVASCRPLTSSS